MEGFWKRVEKILNNLIEKRIKDYGTARDYPSIDGTSKLSSFIKLVLFHVSTIWQKCNEIKSKGVGYRNYINELSWREFSHRLINDFPECLKGNLGTGLTKIQWDKQAREQDKARLEELKKQELESAPEAPEQTA